MLQGNILNRLHHGPTEHHTKVETKLNFSYIYVSKVVTGVSMISSFERWSTNPRSKFVASKLLNCNYSESKNRNQRQTSERQLKMWVFVGRSLQSTERKPVWFAMQEKIAGIGKLHKSTADNLESNKRGNRKFSELETIKIGWRNSHSCRAQSENIVQIRTLSTHEFPVAAHWILIQFQLTPGENIKALCVRTEQSIRWINYKLESENKKFPPGTRYKLFEIMWIICMRRWECPVDVRLFSLHAYSVPLSALREMNKIFRWHTEKKYAYKAF